jgi:ketol-acid reductoisomerase
MHELKLIVDLMYRGGLNYKRFSVSDTAEYGDYVSGPRVTEGVKQTMRDVLSDIQSGRFAEQWIAEYDSGGVEFARLRQADRDHQIEEVGARLRSQMAWLDPVTVTAGQAQASTSGAARPAASGEGNAR